MMKNEMDAILDDLLVRWHDWRSGYQLSRGHQAVSATCAHAESDWSAYDRDNGVADEWIEKTIMEGVDKAIERVPDTPEPWHTTILFEARNLWSQAAVWKSHRLPTNQAELDVLRIEARSRLMRELHRDGIMGA